MEDIRQSLKITSTLQLNSNCYVGGDCTDSTSKSFLKFSRGGVDDGEIAALVPLWRQRAHVVTAGGKLIDMIL